MYFQLSESRTAIILNPFHFPHTNCIYTHTHIHTYARTHTHTEKRPRPGLPTYRLHCRCFLLLLVGRLCPGSCPGPLGVCCGLRLYSWPHQLCCALLDGPGILANPWPHPVDGAAVWAGFDLLRLPSPLCLWDGCGFVAATLHSALQVTACQCYMYTGIFTEERFSRFSQSNRENDNQME